MSAATNTTDHETIRRWTEERGGHRATVAATCEGDEAGLLRSDFESAEATRLGPVTWEQFFETFAESTLTFLYQNETKSRRTSPFFKSVQGDGSGADWLGTNAPRRCSPV